MTNDQRRLADLMSELSEEAYCASWMSGLEYALWEIAIGVRSGYGRLAVTDERRDRLVELSDLCQGWIVFDDANGETWLPREVWDRQFSAWRSIRDNLESDG